VAGIKILGNGELKHALTIEADKISGSAREKIEKAGGTITLREARPAAVGDPTEDATVEKDAESSKPARKTSGKKASGKKTAAKKAGARPKKKTSRKS
jgi:hypothetical protein